MRDIEKRILEFVALATPDNDDRKACCCNVRAASSVAVAGLARQLSALKPVARTFERPSRSVPRLGPGQGRIILHPSAALLAEIMAAEG